MTKVLSDDCQMIKYLYIKSLIELNLILMFLSKKNAKYFNKPKASDPQKPKRNLQGWEDDDLETKQDSYEYTTKVDQKLPAANLLLGDNFEDLAPQKSSKKENKQKFYLNWDELDAKDDIECEKRLIEEIVQPGGIRVKPNDNMLNQFLKEVKGMEVHIISSLLLSKLEVNYPFQVKAKALYTIEYLIKKNERYLSFFKAHVDKLSEFPQPEDNVDHYRKTLKTVKNLIGITDIPQEQTEDQKQIFIDPGYNDDPKSKISNFIQQNANKQKKVDTKKAIIGPGQAKPKQQEIKPQQVKPAINNNDLFSLDLLGGSSNTNSPGFNLLDSQITFDNLLTNPPKKTPNEISNINLLF